VRSATDTPVLIPAAEPRPPRRRARRRILSTGWALAVGIAAALIIVFPLVWVFANSIKPENEIITAHPGLFSLTVTGSNYVQAWDAIDFPRLFLNTVVFAGGVTALSLTFDSLTAYALARLDFPGRNVIFVLVLVTLMLPFQVNLVPLFLFLSDLHWLNTYQGLILPRATNAFGIFFLRQFFMAIPKELEDAARVDGASEFRIYRTVVLRLSVPALLTLGLFHFMYNWNDLLWPLIVSTNSSMYTLSSGLALFLGQHVIEYGLVMAGSVLAIVPMVVAFLIIQRRFTESIATSGLRLAGPVDWTTRTWPRTDGGSATPRPICRDESPGKDRGSYGADIATGVTQSCYRPVDPVGKCRQSGASRRAARRFRAHDPQSRHPDSLATARGRTRRSPARQCHVAAISRTHATGQPVKRPPATYDH
jgi:multiple sugar transport system permease protein